MSGPGGAFHRGLRRFLRRAGRVSPRGRRAGGARPARLGPPGGGVAVAAVTAASAGAPARPSRRAPPCRSPSTTPRPAPPRTARPRPRLPVRHAGLRGDRPSGRPTDRPGPVRVVHADPAANAVDFHYAIPDSLDGGGITAPLDLYVNGTLDHRAVADLRITAGCTGPTRSPTPPASASPTARCRTTSTTTCATSSRSTLPAGTVVRLQVDAGDNAPWYVINTADFEQVARADHRSRPGMSTSPRPRTTSTTPAPPTSPRRCRTPSTPPRRPERASTCRRAPTRSAPRST